MSRRSFAARDIGHADDFFSFKSTSVENVQKIGVLYKLS